MMKSRLAILITLSFVSIAVFGFFAMNHGESHGHSECLGAVAQGATCPETAGSPLAFINFHLSAFKGFSTATVGSLLTLAALLLLLGVVLTAILDDLILKRRIRPARKFSRDADPPSYLGERNFISWISLHENSPTFP